MATVSQRKICPMYVIGWAFVALSAVVLASCTTSGSENPSQNYSDSAPQSYHGPGSNR
jgi:hypothetical protein